MEKQLSVVGYWLGLLCAAVALLFRILNAFSINPLHISGAGGNAIGYISFLHGAELFFLLSIASWCRTAKA
jgi:hypothetical protein